MRIGELAKKARIRPSAIRFYESAGLLPRASRQSGQRRFGEDAELCLTIIEFARAAGFSISEIKLLFHGFQPDTPASNRWRRLAQTKLRHIDQLMSRLKVMQKLLKGSLRCQCLKLEDCGRILLRSSSPSLERTLPFTRKRA
jgi:MerR family redox-sensitive transcriptional activator SoxR